MSNVTIQKRGKYYQYKFEIAKVDGTVTPCGAIGSIVVTPKESIKAMEYFYNKFPKLWGKYGFKDGYNLEKEKLWFAKEYNITR